jgi:hypothetical protein
MTLTYPRSQDCPRNALRVPEGDFNDPQGLRRRGGSSPPRARSVILTGVGIVALLHSIRLCIQGSKVFS